MLAGGAEAGEPRRAIPFEAVFNFRDLGGYVADGDRRVRWRTLFRADGLHRLTEVETERVRQLGIATVIDLRTPEELAERGRFPAADQVAYHHLPVFDVVPDWSTFPGVDSPDFLSERYLEMLDSGGEAVGTVLRLLAEPSTVPAVFHCAAGKDRTGIVASIVLALLGVDRETIAADYALSHEAMERMEAWIATVNPDFAAAAAGRPAAIMQARPETMRRFLAEIDSRYGGLRALAARLGVDADIVERLRENLLV
ncbi:MAG TPA: tyrosine-protein phosphatase [Acidimicrobiales bacterium]|nr:tyrosine-protein phosphatase [Acidimicrobiales bacterium]